MNYTDPDPGEHKTPLHALVNSFVRLCGYMTVYPIHKILFQRIKHSACLLGI